MRIGIDFDGVIADCSALKQEGALRLFNVHIPPSKFKKEIAVGEGLLTLEQYQHLLHQIYRTRELGLLAVPVPEVKTYLEQLQADGHELFVVTSRFFHGELEIAKEWAELQGITVPIIGCDGSKERYCKELSLDVFIDDDLDKLEDVSGVVDKLYLFSWGYNEGVAEQPLAERVFSWKDLYEKVSALSN